MKLFELGSGEQNHDLRKRKPVLLTEEEMSSRFGVPKNKKSLKDIADQLNAVNKNSTLEKAFDKRIDLQNHHKFKAIFENEAWEYSNSRSLGKRSFSPQMTEPEEKSEMRKITREDHTVKSQSFF